MLFAISVLIAATGNKFIILKTLHAKETIAIKAKQTSPSLLPETGMFWEQMRLFYQTLHKELFGIA